MFVSYRQKAEDSGYMKEILHYLKGLQKENIEFWTDRDLHLGDRWNHKIHQKLAETDIALVLVSQAYLDSDYCINTEIRSFIDREITIMPIMLSPCEWERHAWLIDIQYLPGLDETLAELRTKAATVSRLHGRLAKVRQHIQQLSDLKASDRSPLRVLDQLSQLLDDQTWLLGMELRKSHLTLRGVSASPASLIETLEATDILKDVSFDSAITRDGRSEGDRFNIRATLEKAEGGTDQ